MFPRVVEFLLIVGRSKQVGRKLENDVLPILQKKPGFVDFLTLSDKTTPERAVHQFLDFARRCWGNITAGTMTRSSNF
jgi:hypothetical protein